RPTGRRPRMAAGAPGPPPAGAAGATRDRVADAALLPRAAAPPWPAGAPRPLEVHTVWRDPAVALVPDFLSGAEVEHLLQLAADSWQPSEVDLREAPGGAPRHATGIGQGQLVQSAQARTSSSSLLDPGQTPTVALLEQRLACLAGLPLEHLERLAMVRYEPGQRFAVHHDGGYRPKTVFIWKSTKGAGGETHFPVLGLRVVPRRGCAVVWSNRGPGGGDDPRLVHQGLPPTAGVKYGVNCFFNERVVRAPVAAPGLAPAAAPRPRAPAVVGGRAAAWQGATATVAPRAGLPARVLVQWPAG
ncbi:unnamed protein product, partial [Prorocentrum cordatum]